MGGNYLVVKLQQYYIFKIKTGRLKKKNYKIDLSINQARLNNELISIGDSQMLRSLRNIKNQNIIQEQIDELLVERKHLKNKKSSHENSTRLYDIGQSLDDLLFVPEIISIQVENNIHYKYICQNGFFVNGIKFVRLMCSAGQARRNNALFVAENIEKDLKRILNNGRNDIEITPAKFNAYFSLSSSSTYPISTPYFCVVPDCEVTRKEKVDFITEIDGEDDKIEEVEKDVVFNLWDGQGIVSPRFAEQMARELGLDYIPSTFIIRSNFIKGMLCVFDFVKFSDEAGKHIITDIWGNSYNVRDADVIITQSQFKLWSAFNSLSDYNQKCKENKIGWGVSRYSPKNENNHAFLNYQFCQALNLNKDQIASLCSKTVDYFNKTVKEDINYTLLYLLGKVSDDAPDDEFFGKINDNVTKALILNNKLISDPYIKNHIYHTLNKKIKESYYSNLLVDGFYTTIANDPYAFCEYIFGLPINGLLARNEHYNKYWIDKKEKKIASMRAPLTWRSEVNILNFKNNTETRDWYRYLDCCLINNVHGCDHMNWGGSDADGDLILLTNQKEIIDGAYGGLPIEYATKKAPKQKIIEDDLYLSDLKGFNTKVGFLTNISTTMYAMLSKYSEDSKEYKELIRRLKQCRKEQGSIIDATKGLDINPIPKHWTSWTKITCDMSPEEKEKAEFYNSILVDKRPMFMRHLYSNYSKNFRYYNQNLDNYSVAYFGLYLEEILKKYKNKEITDNKQLEFISKYYHFSPLLDDECVTNNICEYMEDQIHLLKQDWNIKISQENIDLLKDNSIPFDEDKFNQLMELYKQYKNEKRSFSSIKDECGADRYQTIEQYNKFIRQEAFKISSDICELTNLAVVICYEQYPSDNKFFVWGVFGEGIVKNVSKNKQEKCFVPFLDERKGYIEYLGQYYSLCELNFQKKEKINWYDDLL